MSAAFEKLREKMAQDTVYWDLKQKVRGLETDHAKMQQNMLELQVRQYQEELSHKPDVLNKLGSVREICNALIEYTERLRETLSGCEADQSALCEAYQQSGQMVCEMKTRQLQNEEKNKQVIENLQDKLKMTTEHQSQLVQYFTTEQQRVDAELVAVKNELASVQTSKEQLIATNADRNRQLDHYRQELKEKEEAVAHLRRHNKRLIHDFNVQAAEMKSEMSRVEKELKAVTASNDSLKTALINQETYTQSICEENNALQEKNAALEQEQESTGSIVKELRANIQDATKANDFLKAELEISINKNKYLEKEIINKTQLLADAETDKQELLSKISIIETENCEIEADLNKATNAKITELTTIIETKNQELDSIAFIVSHLMTEVKSAVDARVKLEITLQSIKSDIDIERQSTMEKEQKMIKQIERLEAVVKERLQDMIKNIQGKTDNIQKELTGPLMRSSAIQPELDDNAVMSTPSNGRRNPAPMNEPHFPTPRVGLNNDSLFNFLSDDSMDEDNSLDVAEVNRRFEALSRGERLTPVPLASLRKRRASMLIPHGGLSSKHHSQPKKNEDIISLSQDEKSVKDKPRLFLKHNRNRTKSKKN
ncbi:myosin-10-like [Hyposmocoma kahamanoa]|uniref:myosin-10-like n=1 Tax=Hyposmocoma kahamanoa TaxID=1477025 RepID=UPI000E6D8715|nr:myosin-10-like [Hyposmocoma kahamanoa]